MKKTLLAVAVLGAAVVAQAAETTTVRFPNATPFVHVPVTAPVVDQERMNAWVEMNRRVHESFMAYQKQAMEAQRQARENTPAFLRIPAVPELPKFDVAQFQAMTAESDRMREELRKGMEKQTQSLQQALANPLPDIEQVLSEREEALDAAVADAERRTEEMAKSL